MLKGVHMLFDAKFDQRMARPEHRAKTPPVFVGKHPGRSLPTVVFKACLA